MSSQKKILLTIIIALTALTAIVVVVVAINFREYGINAAKEKSYLTAEIVRDGLTAHMVNGMMDKRGFFLERISNLENVKNLWLVRSESVRKQFGDGTSGENPRDEIDVKVLGSGQRFEVLEENSKSAILRVSVPYIATTFGNPNCLSCHQAQSGEVLGAVSMVIDISEVRYTGLITILRILAIAIVFLVVAIFIANRYLAPYLELFEKLGDSISKAENGDFSSRVETSLTDEAGEFASRLNSFYEKVDSTIKEIDKKSLILISQSSKNISQNPLIRAREAISEMADIYLFKKTIELDSTKYDIYKRLFDVLTIKFKIRDFIFFEMDSVKNEIINCYESKEQLFTAQHFDKKPTHCRAYRTGSNIYSDEFHKLCEECLLQNGRGGECDYVCIPYKIWQSKEIVISIKPESPEDIDRIKHEIPLILSYLEASRPVLESKMLNEVLRESSLRDPLTGLHNRKYLEEYAQKATQQAIRTKTDYAVLMIDVDFFKMVNDTYGHDVGDLVIKGIAEILKESVRDSDLVVRFGGEEFLALLYGASREGARKVAEKIKDKFSQKSFSAGKEQFKKTLSIGVSMFPQDADAIWKAIKFADIALYKAKNTGRNRVVEFTEDMAMEGENY